MSDFKIRSFDEYLEKRARKQDLIDFDLKIEQEVKNYLNATKKSPFLIALLEGIAEGIRKKRESKEE